MKTSELSGAALDWAVSYCVEWGRKFPIMPLRVLPYSTDWAAAGPIIEGERLSLLLISKTGGWAARTEEYPPAYIQGDTPLIAAMRCYVASKLGNEVQLPEELS